MAVALDPSLPLSPELPAGLSSARMQAGIELLSIPAAYLIRRGTGNGEDDGGGDGGDWELEFFNRAYRMAGLGVVAGRSPMLVDLAARLDAFAASEACHQEFDWSLGEAIDCRFYRVSMARTSAQVRQRCAITFVDQTSQMNTERSLRREMTTDSLTGLLNRTGFGDLVESVIDERDRYAVMVIDLDRFGRLNACLGSLAADELLITVARRIKGALRARDALARIGGDEFGILVAVDEDRDEARALAERIGRVLQAPFRLTDFEIGVECSIGIAIGAEQPGDHEELIRHAQFAVKHAKQSGRTETYQPQALTAARTRFAMETQLRRAIEERRLRLCYQPICDLTTGRVVAFESLARWAGDDGREVSPSEFIPVAEESGLIVPLGRWAMTAAMQALAAWDARAGGHCGVGMSINVSAIQLQRDQIAGVAEAALRETGVAGERIKLELTESALVSDAERVEQTIAALHALGVTLAMDDFGTGYSNLAYLQKLPIDLLKIDRSFVTGMLADRDKVAIVRAILSLAQALGMKTVAEGIETEACAQTLAALGCTYGQGYLYARPLEEAAAWARIAPETTASAIASTRD